MRCVFVPVLLCACVLAMASATVQAEDWPHWRGPNYDGISAEKGLKTDWGDTVPPQAWKREIGSAFSAR